MEDKSVNLSHDSAANKETQNKPSTERLEVQGSDATSEGIVNKRGRGRPRKYLNEVSIINGSVEVLTLPTATYHSTKRPRGRPKGTGKFQALASAGEYVDTAGGSFTPHVLTVHTGEDLVNKIVSFSATACRSVCVLTANGAVSSVTLCSPSSAGTLTYEGRFEILTLTGSSVVSGELGTRRRTSVLSVSLANLHGRVFGGSVEGPLIAAGPGPIQLIVASFKQNVDREIRKKYCAGTSTSPNNFASPEMVNVSINQVTSVAGGNEMCTSPRVPVTRKADTPKLDTIVTENHNFNSTCLRSIDPKNLQKTDNLSAENNELDSSSTKMAVSNNLQTSPLSQPVPDEMKTPDKMPVSDARKGV